MKIVYFANFSKNNILKREGDILKALKTLGNEVIPIEEDGFDVKKLIETANKSDLFLFHHGAVTVDSSIDFQLSLMRLDTILKNITCKKAFWFFEKSIGMGENFLGAITPLVDYGFLNDDTWIRRHRYANLYPMHLAFGEPPLLKGKYRKEYDCDVVFMGNIYLTRRPFMESMKEAFGDKFKIYNDKFGQDFADMCKSAKVIVSPKSPFEDFYWSDRIYQTLAAKGFLIHPKLEGLKEEFKDKICFETYSSWEELEDKVKYWIQENKEKERQEISTRGKKFVIERFSYGNRLKEMLEIIK